MKRIKSCSTLRIKAHQLLNEEEREVFKYAIRNYRKNQSIDALCEIISKIITDANRSCLVSLIGDMLKEEQRSQFLHRCYSKLPGCTLSQHQLTTSEFQVNKEFKSSNLSLRVATFVSKNRLNQSKSNYHLNQIEDSVNDDTSTLKINNDSKTKFQNPLNTKNAFTHSESDELLKTIERCSRKERPTLSNLQDKGFWSCNNESTTDDESSNSYSSLQDKHHSNNKNLLQITKVKETPRFYSNLKNSNTQIVNGGEHEHKLYPDLRRRSKDKSKLMVCKLHFSSINILKESEEMVENLSISTQSTVVSLLHSNSFDDVFIEYNLPIFSELTPDISSMTTIFQPKPFENDTIVHRSIQTQNFNHISNYNGRNKHNHQNSITITESKETLTDQQSQTSFINTCDSSTQTFLA